MKTILLFEDEPAADPSIRSRHMADHLAFLEAEADLIEAAGPLTTVAGDPAGGLWITRAADFETAHRLMRHDPFWPTGLRRSVKVLTWRRVFAEGRRLI